MTGYTASAPRAPFVSDSGVGGGTLDSRGWSGLGSVGAAHSFRVFPLLFDVFFV